MIKQGYTGKESTVDSVKWTDDNTTLEFLLEQMDLLQNRYHMLAGLNQPHAQAMIVKGIEQLQQIIQERQQGSNSNDNFNMRGTRVG